MKTFDLAEKAQHLQLNDLEVAVAAPIYAMQPGNTVPLWLRMTSKVSAVIVTKR